MPPEKKPTGGRPDADDTDLEWLLKVCQADRDRYERLWGDACIRVHEVLDQRNTERAKVDALRRALDSVLVGGNHLALLIGAAHPPYTATCEDALRHYGAGDTYEIWCCWRAIMHARDACKVS